MLFTPLFRLDDIVTMRNDLRNNQRMHMLYGDATMDADDMYVNSSDIECAGRRGVVSMEWDDGVFPECDFLGPAEYPGYGFIDETMVEAHRIMRYLRYNM